MNTTTERLSLKGTQLTTLVIRLTHDFTYDFLSDELDQKISKAPQLFEQSPVVLDVSEFPDLRQIRRLQKAVTILKQARLQPIGCCGDHSAVLNLAEKLKLPLISHLGKQRTELFSKGSIQPPVKEKEPEKEAAAPQPKPAPETRALKVLNQTVRSGQSVYAQGCDLVVNANVNEGGEVLADGNIFIYGTLKGKAMAGAKDNTKAHIFCQNLDAELVSIAGLFLLSDQIIDRKKRGVSQVFIEDDALTIRNLSP